MIFVSEIGGTEAFDQAATVRTKRVAFSLGDWGGSDLHVAAEVRGVGVGLWKFTVEPDGVVSGQLGQPAEDCAMEGTEM